MSWAHTGLAAIGVPIVAPYPQKAENMVNDPEAPDHAAIEPEANSNPLTTPIPEQAKAVILFISVIVGALAVQLPEAGWLQVVNGVVVAVVGYLTAFAVSNRKAT